MEFPSISWNGYYSRIIRGISIDPVAHPEETKASTALRGRSNKFVPRNRSRLKTRKGSQDRDNSAPYLLRLARECAEKYM